MISVTKKQTSLALVVVAFATIMIAGTIASSGSAFAWRERHHHHHFDHFEFNHFSHFNRSNHHGKVSHTDQSISQGCVQPTSSLDITGPGSPVLLSGNNVPVCVNANLGGNAAATDQSGSR
jgi:hypothetical protein